uniref:Uncharacterized protein n=1 Tax=Glossina austeni TaxID=7395 RepID=A0A1A9UTQ0_GLOAU
MKTRKRLPLLRANVLTGASEREFATMTMSIMMIMMIMMVMMNEASEAESQRKVIVEAKNQFIETRGGRQGHNSRSRICASICIFDKYLCGGGFTSHWGVRTAELQAEEGEN